jgi:hypothetical protein
MEVTMTRASRAILIGAGALVLSATASSAAVVCNDEGDCWRVRGRPSYGPDLSLRLYPDDWRWSRGEHYRWREPGRGHGYWRRGAWIEIR